MSLTLDNISWAFGPHHVLRNLSLFVKTGEVLGLVGPNGCGKSTLLRIAAGLRRPHGGRALLQDQPFEELSRKHLAQQIAFLEQEPQTGLDLRVRDVALLGRIPHRPGWTRASAEDHAIAARMLDAVGATPLADRRWSQLSGGERQRVQLARALAQRGRYLVLDEPTNHLDIRHQLDFLSLVRKSGSTALISLHDLNLAATYCDRVAILSNGQIQHLGRPADILRPDVIAQIYRVRSEQVSTQLEGGMRLLFGSQPSTEQFPNPVNHGDER